jgi:uncharacterized protein YdgA (DUF945 family)
MKVLINIILVLIIVIACAAPYGVGIVLEKEYNTMISQLNVIYNGEYKVTGSFAKGYLHSSATTVITPTVAGAKPVTLMHSIQQGPFIVDFKGWLSPSSYIPREYKLALVTTTLDADTNKMLSTFYAGKEAYSIKSVFAFNGSGVTTVKNNPLKINIGPGEVNWQGFTLIVNHDKKFSDIKANMVMPLASYQEMAGAENKSANIANVKVDYALQVATMSGTLNFSIDDIAIKSGDNVIFSLQKLVLTGKDQRAKNILQSQLDLNINQFLIVGDKYGPMILSLKLKNINASALDKMSKQMGSANQSDADMSMQSQMTAAEGGATEVDDGNPQAKITIPPEQILDILSLRPGIEIDLKLDTPKGKVEFVGQADVGNKDLKSIDQKEIITTATGTIAIKVSQEMVYGLLTQYADDQIQQNELEFAQNNKDPSLKNPYTLSAEQKQTVIENWVIALLDKLKDQKLFLEKDKILSTNIKFDKNVVSVNGVDKTNDDLMKIAQLFDLTIKPIKALVMEPVTPSTPPPAVPVTPPKDNVVAPQLNDQELKSKGNFQVMPSVPAPNNSTKIDSTPSPTEVAPITQPTNTKSGDPKGSIKEISPPPPVDPNAPKPENISDNTVYPDGDQNMIAPDLQNTSK